MVSDYQRETLVTRSLSSSQCIILGGYETKLRFINAFPVKQNKKVKEKSGIISAVPSLRSKRFLAIARFI